MTPIMSLLLIGGLVGGLTLLRWRNRENLRNLPATARPLAILLHLAVCLILAVFVWLLTLSLGTPLSDYLGALGLLLVEGLVFGLLSSLILFSRFALHIPWLNRNTLKNDEKSEIEFEGKIIRFEKVERVGSDFEANPKIISLQGRGRWKGQADNPDEESNSQIG